MIVSSIQIKNIKSFEDSGEIKFSKGINILVGPNNAGKSIFINTLCHLQYGESLNSSDIRIGEEKEKINIVLEDVESRHLPFQQSGLEHKTKEINKAILTTTLKPMEVRISCFNKDGSQILSDRVLNPFNTTEPYNFIYPFLSKRKVAILSQEVKESATKGVSKTFEYLNAKVDRVSNPESPVYSEYKKMCSEILEIPISSFNSQDGKRSGLMVNNYDNIPIESMGDGTTNILGLIVNLCMAKNKLFLIEELENDIHPKALKKLLRFIKEKSKDNQFIITTHSNIVTRYLGSTPESKIFRVNMKVENRLPVSEIKEIENNKEERIKIMEDLGYEFIDLDMWKGWIFFEESSAERIVRSYLIPWFVKELKNDIRTVGLKGVDEIPSKFNDFYNLILFIHLETGYKNNAWVIVDGDKRGIKIIEKLKEEYKESEWNEDNFINFSEKDFEKYYPEEFQEEVKKNLVIENNQKKRKAKKELLDKVIKWIESDEEKAKKEFEKSAKEVIDILKKISVKINNE